MSIYNNTFSKYYDYLFNDLAGNTKSNHPDHKHPLIFFIPLDPRTNDWPLIADPTPGLTIIGLYLYFVTSWGPKYMKHREPYNLNTLLIVYNFIQVVVSVFLFVEVSHHRNPEAWTITSGFQGMTGAWLTKYSWRCEPVDFSYDPHALRVSPISCS